jgi:hypothetical protein
LKTDHWMHSRVWLLALGVLLACLVVSVGDRQAGADQNESLTRSFQAGTLSAGCEVDCEEVATRRFVTVA